ncbi:MAG: histidine--tRNA ligase [Mailhella sp.]|nr:histidine--tRNA ligase [Mailhella sp.]
MAQIQAIKGFADRFPAESRLFQLMEDTARKVFPLYGFGELRTPLMEYTDLFCRGIGTETDVVQKEMYSISDSKGRSMSLRPEATAGVMRAYIENGVHARESVSKFFTIGPMFRHERPQKGRLRQFHQINCECLGPKEPEADAEIICMMMDFLGRLGLKELTLQINSLGCSNCRPKYRATLHDWLAGIGRDKLCEDCARRMETNPLRVLDCKVEGCRTLTAGAPRILDNVCPECEAHFAAVLRHLDAEHVPYQINHRLVRGLDYYTRTTWEVVSNNIGSQGSVAGGGRYDGLVAQLGGPEVPGIGFACGMERLALLMENSITPELSPDFYVAVLDETCKDAGFALAQSLRRAGFAGMLGYESRSMKATMRQAGKSNARCTFIIGPDELSSGQVIVKNMGTGEQRSIPCSEAVSSLGGEN